MVVIFASFVILSYVLYKVITILNSIKQQYRIESPDNEEYERTKERLKIKSYFITFISYFIAELFLGFLFGFDQFYLSYHDLEDKPLHYFLYILMQIVYGGMGGIVILIFDYKRLIFKNIKYILCCEGELIARPSNLEYDSFLSLS